MKFQSMGNCQPPEESSSTHAAREQKFITDPNYRVSRLHCSETVHAAAFLWFVIHFIQLIWHFTFLFLHSALQWWKLFWAKMRKLPWMWRTVARSLYISLRYWFYQHSLNHPCVPVWFDQFSPLHFLKLIHNCQIIQSRYIKWEALNLPKHII